MTEIFPSHAAAVQWLCDQCSTGLSLAGQRKLYAALAADRSASVLTLDGTVFTAVVL